MLNCSCDLSKIYIYELWGCFHVITDLYFNLGAYGTVYKAQDLKNEEIVAMKKVRIALTEDGVPMSVLRWDR